MIKFLKSFEKKSLKGNLGTKYDREIVGKEKKRVEMKKSAPERVLIFT